MDQPFNHLIYTQSVFVLANTTYPTLIGECNSKEADENSQLIRLYALIEKLIKKSAKIHLEANGYKPKQLAMFSVDNSNVTIKPECLNNVTQLITNEFMFYTKKRLEPSEFATLFEKIVDIAKTQPENLYLVLSSFAVRALNNKTMNVVAFVECGKTPKLHFMVKNYDSCVDPLYYETSADGKRTEFKNIEIKEDSEKKFPKIKIHGQKYKFSYNNVFEVVTLGGVKKLVSVDICFDNIEMVAKKNCALFVKKECAHSKNLLPIHITHIVTANDVTLNEKAMLENHVAYADPKKTSFYLKKNDLLLSHKTIKSDLFFGTPHSQVYVTRPIPCSLLPSEFLEPVKSHNEKIMAKIDRKKDKKPKR